MNINFRQRGITYSCSILALGFAQAAMAAVDDGAGFDDEIITVTATRTAIDVVDAPATVTVINQEQIADEMATDVRDIVRFEPGVSVRRAPARFGAALGTTGRAGNEDFNIRGIGGNRVLIQVDGIRSPQGFTFGAQEVGRGNATDVGLIKSVEILRGPASATACPVRSASSPPIRSTLSKTETASAVLRGRNIARLIRNFPRPWLSPVRLVISRRCWLIPGAILRNLITRAPSTPKMKAAPPPIRRMASPTRFSASWSGTMARIKCV